MGSIALFSLRCGWNSLRLGNAHFSTPHETEIPDPTKAKSGSNDCLIKYMYKFIKVSCGIASQHVDEDVDLRNFSSLSRIHEQSTLYRQAPDVYTLYSGLARGGACS